MIDRVYFGWDPGGLIRYVMGPGRYNEHENPQVIASFDDRPEAWQPPKVGSGEFDFDLRSLIAAAQEPLKAARLPVTTPSPNEPRHRRFFKPDPEGNLTLRTGTVRHLALRNASEDRALSAEEWAYVARTLVSHAGWSSREDPGSPRWWAVQHDQDGIHVFAVMVRQDTGRRVWPDRDFAALRERCRELEAELGITLTAEADGTAPVAAGRAEREKAARQGQVPARHELRAAVAQAAAVSYTAGEFEQVLTSAGYLVQWQYLPSGLPRGYAVARPGDVNVDGQPVYYGGSRLAADLSLPALQRRWGQARRGRAVSAGPDRADQQAWLRHGVALIDQARAAMTEDPSQAAGIAHAVGEVYDAVGLSAASRWDRAARAPRDPVPATGRAAEQLRSLARGLSASGVGRQSGAVAATELLASLTALGLQIAALYQHQERVEQARAARQASRQARRPQQPAAAPRPTAPISRARPSATRSSGQGESRRSAARRGGQQGSSRCGPTSPRRSTPPDHGPQRGQGK